MKILFVIIAFLMTCICGYLIVKLLKNNNIAEEVKKRTNAKYEKRIKELENIQIQYGNQDMEKLNWMTRFDIDLEMSGLKSKLPWINTELLILFCSIVILLEVILTLVLMNNILLTILISTISVFFMKLIFQALINYNVKKIDDGIIEFGNQLSAYSNATDDLITIMEYTLPYVTEPIKSAVEICVRECRINGINDEAFYRLNLKIKHRYFNMLIENLLEASKNNANYKDVVQRANETIIEYVTNKEVRKANARGANMVIVLMLLILYIVTIISAKEFLKVSIYQFFFGSFGGKFIFSTILFVSLFSLWKCMNLGKEQI